MLASDVISRVRILIGDQDENVFSDSEILDIINQENVDISNELRCYVRSGEVNICEDVMVYDFPDDFISLKQMNIDSTTQGRVVLSTTYKDVLGAGLSMIPASSDLALYYGFIESSQATPIQFRDNVSANQFHVAPAFTAEETILYGGETYFWTE